MGPAQPLDHQPAFSHGMDPMGPPNSDRVPYPYGSERPGHGPTFDRPPSPRSWTPQVRVWYFQKCDYGLNFMNQSLNIVDYVSFCFTSFLQDMIDLGMNYFRELAVGLLGELMLVLALIQEMGLLEGNPFSNRFTVLSCGHFGIN